jgi:hypothetical protein
MSLASLRLRSRILWTLGVTLASVGAYVWLPTWVFATALTLGWSGLAVMWIAAAVEDRPAE